MAIAGLLLGILALLGAILGWIIPLYGAFVWLAAIVFGIVGIVLSAKGKKATCSGAATAGMVLAIIGLVLSAVFFFACGLCSICALCAADAIVDGAASVI